MNARGRPGEEIAAAEDLPQADARGLVDAEQLESAVKDMYRAVAREEEAELHFEVGRPLAEHLGYDPSLLVLMPGRSRPAYEAGFR